MPDQEKLTLKFDPGTIEHLGIKMYSQLPQALAELVANAYDADASEVIINLYDEDPENKRIVVHDNGHGMSYSDVRDKFLVIGRNRRPDDEIRTTPKGRVITGRKGLGKLALFGIGNKITIETTQANESSTTIFSMDWKKIIDKEPIGGNAEKKDNAPLSAIKEYHPDEGVREKHNPAEQGTTITLTELKRVSNFNLMEVAVSLSKMFNTIGDGFNVILQQNDNTSSHIELTRELRYTGMEHEFKWNVKTDIIPNIDARGYEYKNRVKGFIVSSPEGKTMPQSLRGITLYVNGRLANAPGFFNLGQTPHAFSYLSGWIDADFLDEFDEDLISTDRQSLSWDLPEPEKLQYFLQRIVRYVENAWLEGRKEKREKEVSEKVGIDINEWVGTMSDDVGGKVRKILDEVLENPEIEAGTTNKVVESLYALIPKYPEIHWRYLHPEIQKVSDELYKTGNYYHALFEACKQYGEAVEKTVLAKNTEAPKIYSSVRGLMQKSFGMEKDRSLKVLSNAKKTDGTDFKPEIINDFEAAQHLLSEGIIAGYRNPIAHPVCKELSDTGLITKQHCLDALSILTLLFHRLDNAEKTPNFISKLGAPAAKDITQIEPKIITPVNPPAAVAPVIHATSESSKKLTLF